MKTYEKIELFLRQLVADQLRKPVEQVRPRVGYYELGLKSAAIVSVVREIENKIEGRFSPSLLFKFPTIDRLAGYLHDNHGEQFQKLMVRKVGTGKQATKTEARTPLKPLADRGRFSGESRDQRRPETIEEKQPVVDIEPAGDTFPLTEGQKGLWALQKAEPQMSAYNVPIALTCGPELDVGVLNQAVADLLGKRPILGCRIERRDGQLIGRPGVYSQVDIQQEKAEENPKALVKKLSVLAKQSFDLEREPLFRVHLLDRGEQGFILLILIHHIVFDGISYLPLLGDLFTAYRARLEGSALPRAGLDQSFAEFAQWEQNMLAGEEGSRRLGYWREQLAGDPPRAELLGDKPLNRCTPYLGRTLKRDLDPELSAALRAFAQEHRVYFSTVFLAVYHMVLQRYSGQKDTIVGMVTNHRPQARFAQGIGYFIDMLAMRARSNNKTSFLSFLQQTQVDLLDGLANTYPLPALVRDLHKTAGLGEAPLFQVAFTYQDAVEQKQIRQAVGQTPFKIELLAEPVQEGGYELGLEVFDQGDHFQLHLKHHPERFSQAAMERFLDHFRQLLGGVLEYPDLFLFEYPMLTGEEEKLILRDWNRTAREYPKDQTIYDLFLAQAERRPDQIAAIAGAQKISYGSLRRQCDQLAAHLQAGGVGPGDLVAICTDRDLDMLIAMLAVVRSGAAYLPLDSDYPSDRLRYMLEHSQAKTLLLAPGKLKTLKPILSPGMRIITLDQTTLTQGQGRTLRQHKGTDRAAYVLYTSGSTGKPKGVVVGHQALTNFLTAMAHHPGFDENDTLFAVTTYCFDISALELYLPLICGGTVHICSAEDQRDVRRLTEAVNASGATIMQATPATWSMLFLSGWKNPDHMRILCGGEALSETLRDQFRAHNCRVWNMFGPTETTIWSTVAELDFEGPITIGTPIQNTQIYIVDERLNPVPVGVAGEMLIGGDGVAYGYLHQPELTEKRFINSPFSPGRKLYRTGDSVRRLADGKIEYLGRMDNQVKLRGYRIELGEIEARLAAHPAVRETAVVITGEGNGQQLSAFFTTEDGAAMPDSAGLRVFLAETLPAYMLPSRFTRMSRLPLTPNGKVDRKELVKFKGIEKVSGPVVPRPGHLAEPIRRAWQSVLQVPRVGDHDGFFEIGGNSISAVLLAEQIAALTGKPFTVTQLFQNPNVAEICDALTDSQTPVEAALTMQTPVREVVATKTEKGQGPDYYQHSLAVIGMSLHFPGAEDHHAFWDNLGQGVESGTVYGLDRLQEYGVDPDVAADSRLVARGLSLEGKDLFDPEFFGISRRDAAFMDPQFRQLLLHAWRAVEDAGYRPDQIPGTAVFMSAGNNLYQALFQEVTDQPHIMSKNSEYVGWLLAQGGTIPTMISYRFGFTGPSLFVHTNCSSSLTAMHLAKQSILAGEAETALIGAAALMPARNLGYIHQDGLNFAADGRLKAFDAAADGMIGGEGVGVLLVKRADRALADGDPIYAVLRGTALNNDGSRKAGFYAPSGKGHAEVVRRALEDGGVKADEVSYIEAHGTGTKIGDPIEFAALNQVYGGDRRAKNSMGLGSVKTNIGHLDTAAGLAGCAKVILSLSNRQIPATLHFREVNPEMDLTNSPFYIVDQNKPWPLAEQPRRAAVSSLGIGGTNGHAVFEGFDLKPPRRSDYDGQPLWFPLSARDAEALQIYAGKMAEFLETEDQCDLRDIAFTLQRGRVAMVERLLIRAGDRTELIRAWRAFAAGKEPASEFYRGRADRKRDGVIGEDDMAEMIAGWLRRGAFDKLAKAWCEGYPHDWWSLGDFAGRRISLPTYPFRLERFWPEPKQLKKEGGDQTEQLHPMLHRNLSTLRQLAFSSRFTGSEFFLAQHTIENRNILPGVAYLEIAAAAVQHISGQKQTLSLKNIVWLRPFSAQDRKLTVKLELGENGSLAYQIHGGETLETHHLQGLAAPLITSQAETLDPETYINRAQKHIPGSLLYEGQDAATFLHGPAFRGIQDVYVGQGYACAKITLPEAGREGAEAFQLHPALMDAAVQVGLHYASGSLLPETRGVFSGKFAVPFALKQLDIYQGLPEKLFVLVHGAAPGSGKPIQVDIHDVEGRLLVRFHDLAYRLLGSGSEAEPAAAPRPSSPIADHTLLLQREWRPAPIDIRSTTPVFDQRIVVPCQLDAFLVDALDLRFKVTRIIRLGTKKSHVDPGERFIQSVIALAELMSQAEKQTAYRNTIMQVVVPFEGEGSLWRGLSGLLNVLRLEYPKVRTQIIYLQGETHPDSILRGLKSESGEQAEVLLRDGKRFLPQWLEAPRASRPTVYRDQGVYLISGGLGGLGRILARHLAVSCERPVLVLCGRAVADQEKEQFMDSLRALGARIEYRCCDVADPAASGRLVRAVIHEFGDLHGIVHAVGTLRDGYLNKQSEADLRAVLEPKVLGCINLDAAAGDHKLDWFVNFSSLSVLGALGQAGYGAANAFLDAFAEQRERAVEAGTRFGRSFSINWPMWRDGGMAVDEAVEARINRQTGLSAMDRETGLAVFDSILAGEGGRYTVAHGDLDKLRLTFLGQTPKSQPDSHAAPEITSDEGASVPAETTTAGNGLAPLLKPVLTAMIAEMLHVPESKITGAGEFEKYGFDSISFTEFANDLNRRFNLDLMPTVFFEHPNLDELLTHLVEEHGEALGRVLQPKARKQTKNTTPLKSATAESSPSTPHQGFAAVNAFAAPVAVTPEKSVDEPIAVIGMSGRFPMAADIEALFSNLKAGRDCISEVPADRWDWKAVYGDPAQPGNHTNIKWGGFMDGVAEFDPLFFGISPREAAFMDPQQRLLMTTIWSAVEDAGYAAAALAGQKVGLFIGTDASSGYAALVHQANPEIESYSGSSGIPSMGPNRMSYFMDFRGPSEPVETACSSSLIAIDRAVKCMRDGSCDLAVIGGVHAVITPSAHISFSKAGALAQDGRCKTFSAEADGFALGEGAAMLVLKPLSKAEADGDLIYGLIRATAVNHGGRAGSLTAPNPKAQAELLKQAYRRADFDPRTLGYVETHGTGTKLGDPAEINGLKKAMRDLCRERGTELPEEAFCGLGSIKSNIGHLVLAAGVAGVVKVLLQFREKALFPSLHCENRNPYIDLEGSPFYLVDGLRPWPAPLDEEGGELPRRAGVSSFGIGGANAHVVLEEYRAPVVENQDRLEGPFLFVLSARNPARLDAYVQTMRDFVAGTDVDPARLAFSLQSGREAMEQRLAVPFHNREQLVAILDRYLAGERDGVNQGRILDESERDSRAAAKGAEIERAVGEADLSTLAELWVRGYSVPWNELYAHQLQRVRLPGYPFARRRCWIEAKPQNAAIGASLHPLLTRNQSDIHGLRFETELDSTRFYLKDHQVHGKPMLPGVAYLEIAREAAKQAGLGKQLRLNQIVWLRPVTEDTQRLHTRLQRLETGWRFDIRSGSGEQTLQHCHGLITQESHAAPSIDLEVQTGRHQNGRVGRDQLYRAFDRDDFRLGEGMRAVQELLLGSGSVLGRLQIPASAREQGFGLHPSLMDGALQASTGLLLGHEGGNAEPALPFALETLICYHDLPEQAHVLIRYSDDHAEGGKTRKLDLQICDEKGNVAVVMEGFSFRIFDRDADHEAEAGRARLTYYRPQWQNLQTDTATTLHARRERLLVGQLADLFPPDSHCRLLQSEADQNPGHRCEQLSRQLLRFLKDLPLEQSPVNLQILVQDDALAARTLHGMLQSLGQEQPRFQGAVLLLPAHPGREDKQAADQIWQQSGLFRRENQDWQRFDLVEVREPDVETYRWRADGVYLLSGGLGGLGVRIAEHISASASSAQVVLLGRTGRENLSPEKRHMLAQLENRGRIHYRTCDVCDGEALNQTLAEVREQVGPIRGIIHAAGLIRDARLKDKNETDLAEVCAVKMRGLVNLDEATEGDALDFFLVCSSLAAVHGSVGQTDYAAANAFMDAYMAERQKTVLSGSKQGRSISINWPYWADGGMRLSTAQIQLMSNVHGLEPLPLDLGLQALDRLIGGGGVQTAVLFAAAKETDKTEEPAIEAVDQRRLRLQTFDLLAEALATLLQVEKEELDPGLEFDKFGLESIMLTDFSNRLNQQFDLGLMPTAFFEHPTLNKLTQHLLERRGEQLRRRFQGEATIAAPSSEAETVTWPTIQSAGEPQVQSAPVLDDTAVAVIGMSGRFPGAENLDQLWRNLTDGRDCIREIPADRWDWRAYYGDPLKEANKTTVKWGGFMDAPGAFDPLFFGISPKEAETMDPHQRLLMTEIWKCIENAGYAAHELSGRKIGIFVGTGDSGYSSLIAASGREAEGYSATAVSPSVGPNRMSYFLNLRGPSEPVETACSSSLVAICRAVESMRCGSCEAALVGGVQVIATPGGHLSFSKAKALAADGRCKTFAAEADGFAISEGVGMLFLKPLAKAEADGDPILGVIRACAENHGGRANTLTTPNPTAQSELIFEAYQKAGIDPRSLSYIEAHGTGTKLGDPAEINGLKTAFQRLYEEQGLQFDGSAYCGLGSIKSNIGHTVLAAGVAGVIKVLLQLKHETLAKTIHCENKNPYLDLEGSPFYIVDENRPWSESSDGNGKAWPRRAGVSSFGFGGSNAHVLIEAYQPKQTDKKTGVETYEGPYLIPLSAKTPTALKRAAEALLTHLKQSGAGKAETEQAARKQASRDEVMAVLSRLLHVPTADLEPGTALAEYGVDPELLIELTAALAEIKAVSTLDFTACESHSADDLCRLLFGDTDPVTGPVADPINARDLAFTLQVGREPMAFRLAFIAEDTADLVLKLEHFSQNPEYADLRLRCQGQAGRDQNGYYLGKVKLGSQDAMLAEPDQVGERLLEKAYRRRNLDDIATTWLRGTRIQWRRLYPAGDAKRIQLPGYPFEEKRYWVDRVETVDLAPGEKPANRDMQQPSEPGPARSEEKPIKQETGVTMLVPCWDAFQPEAVEGNVEPDLIIGAEGRRLRALRTAYPELPVVVVDELGNEEKAAKALAAHSQAQSILWIGPDENDDVLDLNGQERSRNLGLLALYRCLRGFIKLGRDRRPLTLTALTLKTQAIQAGDKTRPGQAGIHGLLGSIAKENKQWRIRVFDLDHLDPALVAETLRIQEAAGGETAVHRGGRWYRANLLPLTKPPEPKPPYRHGGLYLIIGGAGGLGRVFSRYLIEHFQAQVVWIGRRVQDQTIADHIQKLGAFGPAPRYYQADAGDAAELSAVVDLVQTEYGPIHGLIHSAIALDDRGLARLDERCFRDVFDAKFDTCLAVARVFAEQNLDFMLFFSSIISFAKTPGQSNYAAACTFKDAFAQALGRQTGIPVKIMNWGFWGNVGIVATPEYRARMAAAGLGSIEAEEGIDAVNRLFAGDFDRVALNKYLDPESAFSRSSEIMTAYPQRAASRMSQLRNHFTPPKRPVLGEE